MFQDTLNKSKNIKAGYTLTEVVLAMMIFGIVAVSISLPFSKDISLSYNNNNTVVANNLAKMYLKNVQTKWQTQQAFTTGELVDIDEKYTDSGQFGVEAGSETLITDSNGAALIKRVSIKYYTKSGHGLVDLFLDINKPGMNKS